MLKKSVFVLIIALFIGWNSIAQEARITLINGTVEIRNAGETGWRPASVGTALQRNSVISTGIRSRALISLGASTVTVEPVTMLTLEELIRRDDTEEAVLHLRTGRIRADISPPSGVKTEFTVTSPSATASVRGTSFTFNGRRVTTHSGQVAFSNTNGQRVIVNRNQSSHSDSNQHGRLTLPFETAASGLRPSLPELVNTGSGKKRPANTESGDVMVGIGW